MKKLNKITSLAVVLGLSANILSSVTVEAKTNITFMVGKEEIATQINETVNAYNNSQDLYQVEIMPLAGQNANERMMALYASNNAPVLMNTGAYSDLEQWEEKMLDLSDLPMVAHIPAPYLEPGTVNGKLIGLPTTIEAFGFLYNKNVVKDILGEDYDMSQINSRGELASYFKDISENSEGAVAAIEVSSMDWSLGAHFSNILFTNQAETTAEREQFFQDLKDGKVNLLENDVFNAWVDTFDLMMEYNRAAASPLSADYDSATIGIASGEIATWFMGNWAVPQVREMDDTVELGILPVPIFEAEGAYGNEQISIGVPNTWAIDGEQSTPEEQAGAKDFLTWLYTDEEGQNYYYNVMQYIPITDNASVEIEDAFAKEVMTYLEEDKGLEWMNAKYPPTAFPTMGASIQKYLAGAVDRAGLAAEIENFWKSLD